jgi:predicted permease
MLLDLRLALRTLIKAPGFTAVAVGSLGLGIGAVTTIYTWTDRFLINPLPLVPDASRLIYLQTRAVGGGDGWALSYPTARDWAEQNQTLKGVTVFTFEQFGVRAGAGAERAFGVATSDNYFEILGVRALHGRTFQQGDEGGRNPVVVLGHDYWDRRFKSDPAIVGQRLTINGHGFEVIGVLPPKFGGSYVGLNLDLYLPITWYPALTGRNALTDRNWRFLEGMARIKDGTSWDQARQDLERVGTLLDREYPAGANHALVRRVQEQGPSAVMKPVFLALLAITALVLLIACANVANLLLARATARQREIGVRLAVGAARWQVIRQLLIESAILASLGGGLGLLAAQWGRNAIILAVPPTPFPVGMDFSVNARVAGLALALAAVTVLVFGLWPAFKASRPDLVVVLRGVPTGDRVRTRAQTGLVAAQMALAVVSLASAGLFLRAIGRSHRLDPGFTDPSSILLIDTRLRIAGATDSTGPAMVDRLLERVRAVPGVRRAAIATFVPLGWSCCSSSTLEIDGYTPRRDENTGVAVSIVSEDYFETMGIPILSGRGLTDADREGAARVVLVNEAFSRRYGSGTSVVGRKVRQLGVEATVVGVVRDGKYRQLTESAFPLIYWPLRQQQRDWFTLHVRARGDPVALVETLRKTFAEINPDLPLLDPRTMRDQMAQSLIGQTIGSRTLAVFGALALLLAAIGIYGVMSYLVGQRTREIGVRVALGAAGADIGRMVLRQGLVVTAIGGAIGLLLATAMGFAVRSLLLGVSPADPVVYGIVVLILGSVAVLALLAPARRAVRVDPIVALKAD